ncbi:MAG TPA: acyltransferase family protein [Vicinamibacterales bacterium]|jgi:uncharacterized membrane protein|nr:acyltransferase family protein [Vicinamibacterales bacterium]
MPAPATRARAVSRRAYIDWLRGVAVLIMIMWHSIDSWTLTTGRDSFAFQAVIFLAGWAAPLFLFLAGVSVPLAGGARMARGFDRRAASRLIQRRGWEVFALAHLFRLQSFLLNPHAKWNGLLKPDILNILGLSIVYAAFAWGRARTMRALAWWLIAPAVIIAGVLTPLAPTWWWPTLLHPRLEGYIRVVNNNAVFSLFPTAAYLLAGTFAGALIAAHDDRDSRFQRQMAIWGAALFAAAGLTTLVPWPEAVSFWTGPMAIVTWRVGTMTLMMTLSWRWLLHRQTSAADPLIVFGRTSLFVYWVHVELAYGNISYPLHHALRLPWSVLAYAALTAGMLWLARAWMRRPAGPIVPVHMTAAVE